MTQEELSKKLDELETQLSEAQTQLAKREGELAVAQLSAEDHQVFDTMSEAEQQAFRDGPVEKRAELITQVAARIAKAAALPEEVQKRFDEIHKQLDEERTKREAAEAVVKQERDARQTAELVRKAEADYPHLPGTPDEKGNVLKALTKLTAEEQESVHKLLRAGNEALKQTMTPVGKSASNAGDGDAWAVIEKKAEKIAADEKITKEAAVNKVLSQEPELYSRYLEEKPEQRQ